jgi:succinoglycan biosynthesis protein ExoA
VPPRVSVIVPARNEQAHIGGCVRSIADQDVDGGLEVIVADGRSSDRTAELAAAAGATVVANPTGRTPDGLNAALAAARGEVVVRFDAHARMPPGYVTACVRALAEEPGAVNVGGWRQVEPTGPWGRATAAALASPLGIGNPRIWRRPSPDATRADVDTVPLGCWPARPLVALGGWDERFVRNQDFELNHRLRRAGGRVVFDPQVWSVYRPRESLRAIATQYWQYGWFKALMLRTAPDSLRPRQLAPVGLLLAAAAAALPVRAARAGRTALAVYACGLVAVGVRSGAGWRTPVVFATVHLAWGGGLTAGLVRLAAPRLVAACRAGVAGSGS